MAAVTKPSRPNQLFGFASYSSPQPRVVATGRLPFHLQGELMRRFMLALVGVALLALPASAQTAEDIINNYIKTVGGKDKIAAAKTLRRVGKFTGGGGFEAKVVQENRRPDFVREGFSLQGMTGVNAWDGKTGWKIEPSNGKKDPEALGEEEKKSI